MAKNTFHRPRVCRLNRKGKMKKNAFLGFSTKKLIVQMALSLLESTSTVMAPS